ncbi:hypothetical protein N9D08_00400 [bacterium]|nr:hypothetical protein [bacterium]
MLASDEVKAENGERYGSQNDSKSTVINAQRKPGAIAVESVINLGNNLDAALTTIEIGDVL